MPNFGPINPPTPVIIYNDDSYIILSKKIKKMDSKVRNLFLSGAEFELASLDGKNTLSIIGYYEDGAYYFGQDEHTIIDSEQLKVLLPSNIRELYESINTYADFESAVRNNDFFYNKCSNVDNCRYIWSGGYSNRIEVMVPLLFKEAKSPIGYKKSDTLLLVDATLYFNFKDNEDAVDNKKIVLSSYDLYKYDKSVDYLEHVTTTTSLLEYINESGRKLQVECGGNIYNSSEEVPSECEDIYQLITDDVGEVVLRIDNMIYEKHKYTSSGDEKVETTVIIYNDGSASSGDNVVTLTIPSILGISEDSISDNGSYNKENNTITWNIDYLDSNSEKELRFNLVIPKGLKGEYKLQSNVTSGQVEGIIESSDLNITVMKNPNTGDLMLGIVIVMLLVGALSLVISKIKMKNNKVI